MYLLFFAIVLFSIRKQNKTKQKQKQKQQQQHQYLYLTSESNEIAFG